MRMASAVNHPPAQTSDSKGLGSSGYNTYQAKLGIPYRSMS
jgi:hypothetical protein